jgi:transcriptional regulator with XRE-family HTH domain
LARGWTQLEAAERAGISERLLRKAEAGESLGFRSIMMLADLYSTAQSPLTVDELVSEPLGDSPGMSLEHTDIETMARRWHDELWNLGRLEILAELAAADCVLHAHDRRLCGHAAVRRYIKSTRAAAGEFKLIAERPEVFGDLTVTRWRARLKRTPASLTGRSNARSGVVRGTTWIRVADGLLCEVWKYWHVPFPFANPKRRKG